MVFTSAKRCHLGWCLIGLTAKANNYRSKKAASLSGSIDR